MCWNVLDVRKHATTLDEALVRYTYATLRMSAIEEAGSAGDYVLFTSQYLQARDEINRMRRGLSGRIKTRFAMRNSSVQVHLNYFTEEETFRNTMVYSKEPRTEYGNWEDKK